MAGGRPTSMTPECIAKLEEAFLWGCTDLEACVYADIDKATLYRYQEKYPKFCDRKETLKSSPTMKAKRIIVRSLDDDDLSTAHKVIDRKEGSKLSVDASLDVRVSKWSVEGL